MIEMRWKRIKFHETPPSHAIREEGQMVDSYRVLQYREFRKEARHIMAEWTEWIDVPLEDEE